MIRFWGGSSETRRTLLTKLNKSDEGSKDRGSEKWEYPPGRGEIIPANQQPPVCV